MLRLLALLALAVRFALHQRRPPGGDGPDGPDGPSGRDRPDGSNPPPPAEAVGPAQDITRDHLRAGEPPGSSGRDRTGDDDGDEGRPPDDETDGDDDSGAFTTPEPDGVPKRRDDKWLERKGVDAHAVKEILPGPAKWFDIYVDRSGNMWGVRKGADPRQGEYLGNIDDYGD